MAVRSATKPKGRIGVFTIVGIVVAALSMLGFFLVILTLSPRSSATPVAVKMEDVLVASVDLPVGTSVSSGNVAVSKLANKPPQALTKLDDIRIQQWVTNAHILKGQAITTNLLDRDHLYLPLPQHFVAFTLPTSDASGVAGYILPGDYITIVAVMSSKVQTIYTSVHVLRLGSAAESTTATTTEPSPQPGGAPAAPTYKSTSLMTVVVTQCQAEFLQWFVTNSKLIYTLPSYKDYQPADTQTDPSCASIDAAKGVNKADVNAKWPGLVG